MSPGAPQPPPPPAPANDAFASAAALSLTGTTSVTGSNARATVEPGEPAHAGMPGGRSVWWRGTAPTSGTVTLSTEGSGFDTLLAVYTGKLVSALSEVASNDEAATGSHSEVTFDAEAGTTYWVAVDGFAGASGTVQLGSAGPA